MRFPSEVGDPNYRASGDREPARHAGSASDHPRKADASAESDRFLRLWPFIYWGSYFWCRLEEGA
jgi:hypothetical protein